MAISFPVPARKPRPRHPVLSSRQEAFCRHYVASGNAALAARRAGYAESSARQTGHMQLARPHIIERVRRIRILWREMQRREAEILLARLERAWDAAVAKESPCMMLRVIRMQAEFSGLSEQAAGRRPDLWALPDEDEFGEVDMALETAAEANRPAGRESLPGPLAGAVRAGRDRAERALARHRAGRRVLERQNGFDARAHLETAGRLYEAAEERRRLPGRNGGPDSKPDPDAADAPAALAPDDPAVYDDPPEDRCVPEWLMLAGPGPDARPEDSLDVDDEESGWMFALREGIDPIDPWTEDCVESRKRTEVLAAEQARRLFGDPSDHDN